MSVLSKLFNYKNPRKNFNKFNQSKRYNKNKKRNAFKLNFNKNEDKKQIIEKKSFCFNQIISHIKESCKPRAFSIKKSLIWKNSNKLFSPHLNSTFELNNIKKWNNIININKFNKRKFWGYSFNINKQKNYQPKQNYQYNISKWNY